MKRYIETFFALVPYLEQYPLWVKALISIWLLLTAAVFLALLFGRPHQPLPEETASPKAVTASHAVGAEPQSPQRIFINRTVDEMVEPLKDMTSYQVAEFVKRTYVGKWFTIRWLVSDVSNYGGELSVSLSGPDGATPAVIARFARSWEQRLNHLRTGDSLQIRGRITSVDKNFVHLADGEIINEEESP